MVFDVACYKDIIDERMNYIDIDPYDPELVGPNSIDLRIGNELLVYEAGFERHQYFSEEASSLKSNPDRNWMGSLGLSSESVIDMNGENETHKLALPEEGLTLWPGILYLASTIETIGSNSFVPIVEGRSSVGRLGIHVHVTAGFCDLGFRGTITLEIHVIHPVRIYPNKPICQAYFLRPEGEIELYKGRYQNQVEPTASRFGVKPEVENG
jgi:dCTP deaminase